MPINRISYIRTIFSVVFIFVSSSLYSKAEDNDTVSQILEWSQSVKAFSGEFESRLILLDYHNPDPKLTESMVIEKIWHVIYKADGTNRFMDGVAMRGEKLEFDGLMSKLDGTVNMYRRDFQRADINCDADFWGVSWSEIITPEMLFGNFDFDTTLLDCYTNGHVEKFELDDSTVVYSFWVSASTTDVIDVYWNRSAHQVLQIDHVTRPVPARFLALLGSWDKKPFELRQVKSSLLFNTMEQYGDVLMPVHAQRKAYKYNKDDYENLVEALRAGKINEDEYDIAYAQLPLHLHKQSEYFLKSCKINVPIPREDFEIEMPGGIYVVDRSTGEFYDTSPIGSRPETTRMILIVAGIFFLVVGAGSGYAYSRIRKKTAV